MSSAAARIARVLVVWCCLGSVSSALFSSWWHGNKWDDQKPASCPYRNDDTNECSTLVTQNVTCATIACCYEFGREESHESVDSDSFDDGVYYSDGDSDNACRLCYTLKNCTLYICQEECCEGYTRHRTDGECISVEGETDIHCENGRSREWTHSGGFECVCPWGSSGKQCEIHDCACSNGGHCENRNGSSVCVCPSGFYGSSCEKALCDPACENNASCIRDGSRQYCICDTYFMGHQCQIPIDHRCPTSQDLNSTIESERCQGNEDCPSDLICCKHGHGTACSDPIGCAHDGKTFKVNEYYITNCTTCQCVYTASNSTPTMVCWDKYEGCGGIEQCDDGDIITYNYNCCPVCSRPTENELISCPQQNVSVYTDLGKSGTTLSVASTGVRAHDKDGNSLEDLITLHPGWLNHCGWCDYKPTRVVAAVRQYASNGDLANTLTCSFFAISVDNEPPTFSSCPGNIYVLEDEIARWIAPSYSDNAGVAFTTPRVFPTIDLLPVGVHVKEFRVTDYSGNTAMCDFKVIVSSRDVPHGMQLQQGRSQSNSAAIIALIVGGLVFIGAIVLFACIIRRRQRNARGSAAKQTGNQRPNDRQSPQSPESYYTTINSVSSGMPAQLPLYSDLSFSPPAYTSVDDLSRDVNLAAPPSSYSNAVYGSLPNTGGTAGPNYKSPNLARSTAIW